MALDPYGRELLVCSACELQIGESASPQYVLAEYTERETDWLQVAGGDGSQPSRIEEGVVFRLASDPDGAVALGRLVRRAAGWKIDPRFRPRRVPSPMKH